MKVSIRRQLRILQAYAALSLCALAFLSVTAFTQATSSQRIDELTVQRINVVEPDGTLRLVVSNKARMHPGVLDGVTINRTRTTAGLLFFNDEGDEVGGLSFTGTDKGGRRADSLLAFDQLKQDQTVAIHYQEGNGQKMAGLQVWDRSDQPLSDLIRALNAANALPPGSQRDAALTTARLNAQPGVTRLFAGKANDKSATVSLADAKGKPRLVMKVAPDGAASIEFLDADGKMVQRIPDVAR